MIVPEYWSEAKEKVRVDGRAKTLRRFGWSDISESDAYENAKTRVRTAAALAISGETVLRVDPKVPYNGADGLPIREEIIERHGETVVTRNSYGALCLNTPDVLFADIDVEEPDQSNKGVLAFFALLIVACILWVLFDAWWPPVVAIILGAILATFAARASKASSMNQRATAFDLALGKIENFSKSNPSWVLRVYRTPKGFRVLVMHDTFDPRENSAFDFMESLNCDPLYLRMCRNQKCFRARISPKPWRIGMEHIRPRPGVWPINQKFMEQRRSWVSEYEQKSTAFSSCRFEASFGSGRTAMACERVRELHDQYSNVDSGLPIA